MIYNDDKRKLETSIITTNNYYHSLYFLDPVPEIYMWSTERIDFEGTDLQLFCRATGTDTTITWWDNQEQQITQDDYNYKVRQ